MKTKNLHHIGSAANTATIITILFFSLLLNIPAAGESIFLFLSIIGLISLKQQKLYPDKKLNFFIIGVTSIFWLKFFSLLWSIDTRATLRDIGTHIHFLLAPLIIIAFHTAQNLLAALKFGLKTAAAMLLLWMIYHTINYGFPITEALRMEAGAQNPGVLGQIVGVYAAWALLLGLKSRDKSLLLSSAIFLGAVYFAGGRSHWTASLAIYLATLIYIARDTRHFRTVALISIIPLFAGAMAIWPRVEKAYDEYQLYLNSWQAYRSGAITTKELRQAASSSVGNRAALYIIALNTWPKSPWLGFGAGTSKHVIDQNAPLQSNDLVSGHWHQQYIHILMELGILGFLALIFSISLMIKYLKTPKPPTNGNTSLELFFITLAQIAIVGLFTGSMQQGLLNTHIAASFAFCAALKIKESTQNNPATQP
ncbi:O-antigen ligase family protein [Tepidimonas aquatica]|uniref:O-Antigen ligase n=1 Tax=Tepidimonas aquatica TaxID=247482 RepID=A0A554WNH9_9BURK|nr:O-antigen ligase family protein [Tepidimonas aquatica]TSE25138.1 O-Antigen ligase [Tepidimonas aquatica]